MNRMCGLCVLCDSGDTAAESARLARAPSLGVFQQDSNAAAQRARREPCVRDVEHAPSPSCVLCALHRAKCGIPTVCAAGVTSKMRHPDRVRCVRDIEDVASRPCALCALHQNVASRPCALCVQVGEDEGMVLSQRQGVITKHRFALHLIRDSTVRHPDRVRCGCRSGRTRAW